MAAPRKTIRQTGVSRRKVRGRGGPRGTKPGKGALAPAPRATKEDALRGRGDGGGAVVIVAEKAGRTRDRVENAVAFSWNVAETGGGRKGGRKRVTTTPARPRSLASAMAAIAHEVRVRILLKLLEGPGTYQALKKVTRQQAGPLYHHINQLRVAGAVRPKQRDLYELTRGGRNLILAAAALAPLVRDQRARPIE